MGGAGPASGALAGSLAREDPSLLSRTSCALRSPGSSLTESQQFGVGRAMQTHGDTGFLGDILPWVFALLLFRANGDLSRGAP